MKKLAILLLGLGFIHFSVYAKEKMAAVKGIVKDSKEFGIFIKLENNLDGLIRNEDFGPLKADEVKNGDEIEAVVVNIDTKKNRVRLSIRRLEQQQERDMLKSVNDDMSMTLGDAIKDQFKK